MNDNLKIGHSGTAVSKYDVRHYGILAGEKRRVLRQRNGTYFVFMKRSHKRGWVFSEDEFPNFFDLVPEKTADEKTVEWHKRLKKAVGYLEASGLWPNLKETFSNLLAMSYEDHKALRELNGRSWNYDMASDPEYARLKALYPFAFGIDETNGKPYVKTDYCYELSDCRLKTMYFGKTDNGYAQRLIDEAFANGERCSVRGQSSYDVSFEYRPDRQRAWYSEEYKGYGNGHYYLALDNRHAVFGEDD